MKGARRARAVVPLLLGAGLAVSGIQLGQWQLRRADEKADLQRTIDRRAAEPAKTLTADEEPPEWSTVRVHGEWLAAQQVLIDNRVRDGRPGYEVAAPLALADGRVVIVNRGWIAAAPDRRQLPRTDLPAGAVDLVGVVRRPQPDPFRLGADAPDSVLRQHLIPAQFADRAGHPVLPWILQQTSDAADGLVRAWPRPDAGIDRHRGYAVQWFGLATLAGGLTLYFGWRRLRGEPVA